MTYAELLNYLYEMPKDRLEDTVTIYDKEDGEFYAANALGIASDNVNDQLDNGHRYLIIKASTEPY